MKWLRWWLSLLIALTAAAVFAQADALSVEAGTPVVIELDGGNAVELLFTTETITLPITVTARSLVTDGSLDLTLEVLQGKTRLAFNDDHGSSRANLVTTDSLIESLSLPNPGTYVIRVGTFNGVGEGQAEVLVEQGGGSVEPPSGETVDTDAPIIGVVPNKDSYTATIQASAGESLTISVRSLDNILDPIVGLYSADGTRLVENDDHGSNDPRLGQVDSQIRAFTIPADGTYTIRISGFGGTGGEFELLVERGAGAGVTPDTDSDLVTINERIDVGNAYTYYLNAQAGEVYTITARSTSDNFDPDVAIYRDDDTLLYTNYDHGSSDPALGFYDARINNFIIPTTGLYLVEVTGYDVDTFQAAAGSFTLTIERTATSASTAPGEETVLLGEIASGGIYAGTLNAEAGSYVTITVRGLSSGFDPIVTLIAPDGTIMADNDDHGTRDSTLARFDAQLYHIAIPETGEYTYEVSSYNPGGGSFGVTLTIIRP